VNSVDFIMAYEGGELDQEEVVKGFQALIDSGLAWQLQGSYGRTAKALIDAGLCHLPRVEDLVRRLFAYCVLPAPAIPLAC
jgi:hypothetical protein